MSFEADLYIQCCEFLVDFLYYCKIHTQVTLSKVYAKEINKQRKLYQSQVSKTSSWPPTTNTMFKS